MPHALHAVFRWLLPVFTGIALGIASMTLHELGHIACALLVGVRVKYVGLRWKGLYTVREAGPPAKNLLVSFAGPAVNLLLILTAPLSQTFALANFCIGLGNIIPIRGSDGHRILACFKQIREEKAGAAPPRPGASS
jgi:Zn-dependent protease